MYCENCGNKLDLSHKYCTKCGHRNMPAARTETVIHQYTPLSTDKWWHRLLRVIYVVAWLPLLGIIPMVWGSNTPSCYTYTYSGTSCYGSYGEAFWYSLLTLVIYIVVLRLIKIAVLYVAVGRKPEWGKQFKKLF